MCVFMYIYLSLQNIENAVEVFQHGSSDQCTEDERFLPDADFVVLSTVSTTIGKSACGFNMALLPHDTM